jgi:hypothetical protein
MDKAKKRRPLKKPDPDRVAQGDEEQERERMRARRDVSEGTDKDKPADQSRVGQEAERGLETRPSVIP